MLLLAFVSFGYPTPQFREALIGFAVDSSRCMDLVAQGEAPRSFDFSSPRNLLAFVLSLDCALVESPAFLAAKVFAPTAKNLCSGLEIALIALHHEVNEVATAGVTTETMKAAASDIY